MTNDPAKQAQEAVAIADAEIKNIEAEIAVVRRQLAGLSGADAEQIAIALRGLVDKIDKARTRRAAIARRAERVARMAELTVAMRELQRDLDPLLAAGDRGARFDALRKRALELQEEVARLKGGAA